MGYTKPRLTGMIGCKWNGMIAVLGDTPEMGMHLTESMAVTPAASVSGLYFAHPESKYFGVGKIAEDQLQDYPKRKGMSITEAEKWLRPNLF